MYIDVQIFSRVLWGRSIKTSRCIIQTYPVPESVGNNPHPPVPSNVARREHPRTQWRFRAGKIASIGGCSIARFDSSYFWHGLSPPSITQLYFVVKTCKNIWRFPKIGVPPVIIHVYMDSPFNFIYLMEPPPI